MVFESMVSDLLNRFIGDYVENLDKSQLKIGIWGADVSGSGLRQSHSQLVAVCCSPVASLEKQSSNAAVCFPAAIKYDATKEERYQQEAKQRELQRIEEALQTAERRGSYGPSWCIINAVSPPLGWLECGSSLHCFDHAPKFCGMVIKNLQVKISRIHLRYEDDVSTDPELGPGSSPVFWCIKFLGTFLNLSFTDVCFSCQTHSAPYRWE
ncbi:hypothetical protein XENOCAPTIV_029628 [Xenoophorus captivus]|uniref:Uncharacterized protein n=1 Tax=Xenoophorus captivus TaxID=1517983 RepID=A0ABV0SC63_9TELE